MTDNTGITTATEFNQYVQTTVYPEDTETDELIVEMLLIKSNKDNDTQQKFNKLELNDDVEYDSEEVEKFGQDIEEDKFDILEDTLLSKPQHGYKSITKDNIIMKKCRNGYKLLTFPDPSKICKLRIISDKDVRSYNMDPKPEQIRKQKHFSKEEHIIANSKIDKYTQFLIHDMKQKQFLKDINNMIDIGESTVILHADVNPLYPSSKNLIQECIIKIFQGKDSKSRSDREDILLRAEREKAILLRLERTAVQCPRFICRKQHIVIMSFIGQQQMSAPKLKDFNCKNGTLRFTAEKWSNIFQEVVEIIKNLYEANVIHGNLLENILWHNDRCYVVDFASSVDRSHECASSLLYRHQYSY